jgi:hypothetical protein
VPVTQVDWEIDSDAPNWNIHQESLHTFPVPRLEPGTRVHVPVRVSNEGPAAVEFILRGRLPSGERYERRRTLSKWG